eukprot:511766_1
MATAIMRCPTNGICDIQCSFSRACYHADIFTTIGTTLTVGITADNAFEEGKISCLDSAICQLTCAGNSACKNAEINAQNSNNAQITLYANGPSAFENGRIYGSSGAIATVWVECQGQASCRYATFDASISAVLTITNSIGFGMLQNSEIHCPDNGANEDIVCTIDVNGENPFTNAVVYAAESFRDVYIHCQDSGSPCDENDINSPTRDPTMPPTRDPTPSPITSSGQNPVTISPTPVTALLRNPTLNPFAEREVKQISTTPMSITVFKTPTAKKDDSFVVVVCIVSGVICCAISGIVCYGRYKVKRDVPGEQSQRSSSFIGSAIDKTNINAQSQNANRVDNGM